ncbi:Peptidase U9, T4 prohead protease [uncultured Caudovirales phage]|uniref:Peptidase U9, T4 prohead protease n=1 Tax=uncultured Caudovirales phage TaxID=2100421 RepID=A0A6J5SSY6_9CAUD|nr:Peptidase U9, T4 prohead protease [uncultured Caudovirales phage]
MTTTNIKSLNQPAVPENSVFIIEHLNEAVTVTRENNDVILEGTAAVFGVMNENNRIYEKEEYLPHLTYLNEKIKQRRLFGELDHPQKFDVSLANVSHVIEGLTYDEPTNSVKIRLRLLDTPCGRIAKTLVEAGCTISISSRAAGNVDKDGKVKLAKVFTYDAVAEPGFAQASLGQVSESLQNNYSAIFESLDSLRTTAITTKLTDISENFGFEDSVKIYRINNQEIPTKQNNTQQMANEFVTKEEMNQYSELVKKKFSTLQENISKNNKGLQKISESATEGESPVVAKMVEYVNYLAGEMEQLVEYSNYLSTMLNQGINYTEHVAEKVNTVIDYSDYLAGTVEKNIQYSSYLGEKLNENINYSEYIAENVEKTVEYANYIAENVDRSIQYTEYVAESAEKGIEFSNYLAENLDAAIKYSNYLGENLDQGIKYSEYIAESLNEKITPSALTKTRSLLGEVKKLNEGVEFEVNETSSVDDLVGAVDGILTHIKSNSAKSVLENKYPFLKLLNEGRKQAFYNLDQATKSAIVETMQGAIYFNEGEVVNIMEAVLNKQVENTPNYIKLMPAAYKQLFEGMTDGEKNWIASQANNFTLNTSYQVKSFWDSRDFRGINERIATETIINNNSINENQGKEGYVSLNQINESLRGYSNNYMDALKRRAQN